LFEEAAGIGKYKHQRKESRSKLEKTRQDLLRINDKVAEADRQVKMLARHVEKARRYKSYYDALKELEIAFENKRYSGLTEDLKRRKAFLEETEGRRELLRASVAASESRIEKMRLGALEKENELEAASRDAAEAGENINKLDRDASVAAERLNNLRATGLRLEQESAALDKKTENDANLKTEIEKGVVEREAQLQKSAERAAGAGGELAQFDGRLGAARELADRLGRDQIDLVNRLGEARNRLSSANSGLTNALERRERDEREMRTLEERYEEYGDAIEVCRTQLAQMDSANANYQQARETLSARIEAEEERYREFVEKEKHLEAQISSNKSQLKFLAGLDAAFEGYESGVKALLTAGLPRLKGIAADLVNVSDEAMLPLVEKLAGSLIQTVVFDTDARLDDAVRFLRGAGAGAARMVSLERLGKLAAPPAVQGAGLRDVRTLIETADGCEALADALFGRFAIADGYETAAAAALSMGTGGAVITPDGVICGGDGSIAAGDSKKDAAGILQRKRQIEKLAADMETFEAEHQAVLTEKDICVMNRDAAKVAQIELNEKIAKGLRQHQEQETTIRHHENEMQNITVQMQSVAPRLEDLVIRITEMQGAISAIEAEVSTLGSRRDILDEQAETARSDMRSMEEERIRLADRLKNIELEVHGLTSRIGADKKDIERLASDIEQNSARKQAKIEEKERCAAEIVRFEDYQARKAEELEAAKTRRAELEAVRDAAREEYSGRLQEIDEARNDVKAVIRELEEAGNAAHDAELKQARDEQERRHIRERIWNDYELDLESLEQEGLTAIDEDDETVIANISMYKERIKHVGQVNMAAIEDYETENARLQELTDQRDDLQSAVDELEKAITRLDKEARAQFLSTFAQVQKNFAEMFTTLFEGGEANISLQEDADPLEAEIHINVRPAGKKMRGVQLLSGGERALTAISLLFALYLVKPSAYCILDELDAPLDDANISRFVRVLSKFAEKTQFIIITHNKRTMEAADLLYGVTQQELGVSTIASVKFDGAALRAA
jgi:chromosome segregation protein